MSLLAFFVALFVGTTLGLLGAGGSILTVPGLIFALGVDPKVAIVMGLPIVGAASFVGAVRNWLQKNIDLKVALAFGVANMAGSFGGATVARGLDGELQLMILLAVMVVAAFMMIRNGSKPDTIEPAPVGPHRITPAMLMLGLVTGTLTGIVGIGGGFILVPALVVLGRLTMREATGTSMTVITMNTISAFVGYRGVVDVPWNLVLWFGGVTAIGVMIGQSFAARVPERLLKRAFGVLLLFVGALLVWRRV